MEIFSRLLHEKSKSAWSKDYNESDPTTWPTEWKTRFYKEYKRFPSIPLPDIDVSDIDRPLTNCISSRKSDRDLISPNQLNLKQLSVLLKYSCGEFNSPEKMNAGYRAQPSAGARFPIEMYVLLFHGDQLESGVYHYNVKNHTLEWMWEGGDLFNDKTFLMRGTETSWTNNASALLVMSGVFWRSQNKYGARGYRMACIEVGAIIQNLYLVSQLLNLKCVAFSGTNDDKIESLLDFNTETESLIMSTVIGS